MIINLGMKPYFKKKENGGKEAIFSIDEKTIQQIGRNLRINKDDFRIYNKYGDEDKEIKNRRKCCHKCKMGKYDSMIK